MKARQAVHIAEHLWNDTVQDGSLLDQMVKLTPQLQELSKQGRLHEMDDKVKELQSEMIARWANIIMDSADHVEGDTHENKV